MKRRHFITISTAALAALTLPAGCRSENFTSYRGLMPMPEPLSKFCSLQELQSLGVAYMKVSETENDLPKLGEHLFKKENGDLVESKPEVIAEVINSKIKNDFINGKTVILNGWVISVTEARMCSVLSLS